MTTHKVFPYVLLFIGICIAATSAILVRMAQMEGVPSMSITSWRLIFAVTLLTPFVWYHNGAELRQLQRNEIKLGIISGIFLAVHLATWIASLALTSVASSTVLVTTNPLWIAIIAFVLWREKPSSYIMLGLGFALIGSVLIAFSDGQVFVIDFTQQTIQLNWQALIYPEGKGETALLGDVLALIGAVAVACYFLIGRNLRRRLSNISYVWLAYTSAMVTIVIATMLSGFPLFGYTPIAYLWLLLVAVGPQLMGHTIFNWSLAHLSAIFIALAILGEPIGSAILAYFIFNETFAIVQLIGFVLLLFGIAIGIIGEQH
ncbi:MAG: hypothetical protein B6242_12960 [Anaerolineaceae bacterium 4572_78]|nr:MAG: hypothetical protein B6242_12960 [Anaerolineaceae bacterium 4572_78]